MATIANTPSSTEGDRPRKKKAWPRITGHSASVRQIEEAIIRVASFDCAVLVAGETGCGKEEVARAIHAAGPRHDRPFVPFNCGELIESLAEGQLFGHEQGSFTGASDATPGVFRAANGGIVFLDEIGELPLNLQPKLLRVLQQREVTPVGSTQPHAIDVQVIAATNRELSAEVAAGRFREDLFYRLNTISLAVPPLRARRDDIPLFVERFSEHFAREYGRPHWQPTPEVLRQFVEHSWPGNVRELVQTIQRIYIFDDRVDEVLAATLHGATPRAPAPAALVEQHPEPVRENPAEQAVPVLNLDQLRRLAVRQALTAAEGHRGRAAALLGVSLNTMTRLALDACPDMQATRGRKRSPRPR
jgi:transcriptional regulator with GAF, ATPase, and Fis domain